MCQAQLQRLRINSEQNHRTCIWRAQKLIKHTRTNVIVESARRRAHSLEKDTIKEVVHEASPRGTRDMLPSSLLVFPTPLPKLSVHKSLLFTFSSPDSCLPGSLDKTDETSNHQTPRPIPSPTTFWKLLSEMRTFKMLDVTQPRSSKKSWKTCHDFRPGRNSSHQWLEKWN